MNKKSRSNKPQILHRGLWQVPYKAINVLCSDGIRRTCKLASEPDTFFSIPASCQVKGKSVSGFIVSADEGEVCFCQYLPGKNSGLLPDLPFKHYPNYTKWD